MKRGDGMYPSYQDIPRLYTAMAEWGACVIQILISRKRMNNRMLTLFMTAALIGQAAFLILTETLPTIFWLPCMLGATGLMFFYICVCCKEPMLTNIASCARAFLIAEFAASLEWQLHCYILHMGNLSLFLQLGFTLLVYMLVFYAGYHLERIFCSGEIRGNESASEILVVVLVAVLAFLLSNFSFVVSNSPFSGSITQDIFYIRTLVDLGGVAILYAYQGRIGELYMRKELLHIHSLFKSQYDYYRNFQENMEFVHIKYHDLKHQMEALRSVTDSGERERWLNAMEQEIEQHYIWIQTGNAVLDTILSGKMLYCKKHDIRMTCVADGHQLDFLHVMDICSIFGNALDNAIEHVLLIPDKRKRLIHVSVSERRGCTYILIENYTDENLKLEAEGQMLKTTKQDKENHGYGLKSIRYSVEKYGGNCGVQVENGWFRLQILFEQKLENSLSC